MCAQAPSTQAVSLIIEFETTDKRYYFVPCQDCGEKFVIKWGLVRWDAPGPIDGSG